jgi:hypothetical protein
MTTLWDLPVRSADPLTSRKAAVQVHPKRASHCLQIMTALVGQRVCGVSVALTHSEIAARMGWDRARVHKRLADCRRNGPWCVEDGLWSLATGPPRACRIHRTQCLTYYVVKQPE